jgi:protein-disulfide reductase (glutathione)
MMALLRAACIALACALAVTAAAADDSTAAGTISTLSRGWGD